MKNKTKLVYFRTPININFDITYACNQRCRFCSVYKENYQNPPASIIRKVLDHLIESDVYRINFFGGEPLLVKNLADLIIYTKKRGVRTSVVTNGLLLDKAFIAKVEDYLDSIAISIHGFKKSMTT